MNNQITNTIVATINSNEVKETKCRELAKSIGGEKISHIDTLFAFGVLQANYSVSMEEFDKEERGNGTSYYDPIAAAVFVDATGAVIAANSSISLYDGKTNRRLYAIVLAPGNNIVVHDRFKVSPTPTFVMTSLIAANDLVGMHTSWTVGCTADLVNMCRLFGFEFDRQNDEVYMPVWVKHNWFKSVGYHFVDNRRQVKLPADAALAQ